MNNNNNFRLSKKKQVQLMIALTILAWATQTLMHQWGYGQTTLDNSSSDPSVVNFSTPSSTATDLADLPAASEEKFTPDEANATPAGTLELRADATVGGPDIKLKQICRWSDEDSATFTPIAETTLFQFTGNFPIHTLTMQDICQTLHEAGVNVAMINFAGATQCTVRRSDAQADSQQTLQQWIDAQQPVAGVPTPVVTPASEVKPDPTFHTLRELLTNDLSQRLNIPAQTLQLTFAAEDEKLLGLAEPMFKFDIQPSRALALGSVTWQVNILTDTASRKVTVSATARAWVDQVLVAEPVAAHTVLQASDFSVQRILVDAVPDRQPLKLDQCIGQEAAEDLRAGTVMTAQMIDPLSLVKPGQLVTVDLRRGNILLLRSVARAMEQGSLGQTIRVRNENTRDTLDVTVTGSQEARLGQDATPPN